MLQGDAGIFENWERSERFMLFHAVINCENTFPLHFLDKWGCCLGKGSQEKTANCFFFVTCVWSSNMSCLFTMPQGKLRRSQFSQKSSLCFSFSYFIFCGCSVNLYMLMSPLQSTYGHMVEKTPCWMANDAVRPWKERILPFWKMSSLCILCPTALFAIQQFAHHRRNFAPILSHTYLT